MMVISCSQDSVLYFNPRDPRSLCVSPKSIAPCNSNNSRRYPSISLISRYLKRKLMPPRSHSMRAILRSSVFPCRHTSVFRTILQHGGVWPVVLHRGGVLECCSTTVCCSYPAWWQRLHRLYHSVDSQSIILSITFQHACPGGGSVDDVWR